MKFTTLLFFLFSLNVCLTVRAQEIKIGKVEQFYSNTLNENRSYSVYLPPSYQLDRDQKFPVLYLLDGHYNFHYVTGLIELYSGISEDIPELIVIGLAGNGTETYRNNCKPTAKDIEDSGNADDMIRCIETELIPAVNEKYKTNSFKILAGHSIGGLFTINMALNRPTLFNHYIAISPALQWGNEAMLKIADEKYTQNPSLKTSVYVSLGDEEGMKVEEFLKQRNSDFIFKKFKNSNHNSIGEPTYQWALNAIFSEWKIKDRHFNTTDELVAYHKHLKTVFHEELNIPNGVIYATINYYLKDNSIELNAMQSAIKHYFRPSYPYFTSLMAANLIEKKDFSSAEKLIREGLIVAPESYELYYRLGALKLAMNMNSEAKTALEKSRFIANKNGIRYWQMEEIMALLLQL